MRVQPKLGLKVRHPVTKRHLPDAPTEVPESIYWLRRVRSGDVVIVSAAEVVIAPAVVVPVDQITDSPSDILPEGQE